MRRRATAGGDHPHILAGSMSLFTQLEKKCLLWCLISFCLLSGEAFHGWGFGQFNAGGGHSTIMMSLTSGNFNTAPSSKDLQGVEDSSNNKHHFPLSSTERMQQKRMQFLRSIVSVGLGATLDVTDRKANAIGTMFELSEQNMVLQDITLNVPNTKGEALLLSDTLQQSINVISDRFVRGESTTVLAFGPTAYESPKSFRPGISSFFVDGGHATMTLRDRVNLAKTMESGEEVIEIYEAGNGLRYIKFGTEVLRLSKAIQAGCEVKYAYGWVDLVTPGGIPYQFVVGTARDPLMTVCLATSDMKKSITFFTESLGMQILPFKNARALGSNFEPQPRKDEVCVGYGNSTLSLVLTPTPNKGKVEVGNVIEYFSIVVDDSNPAQIPTDVRNALDSKQIMFSPDGYPFKLLSYTEFQKSSLYLKDITSTSLEQMQSPFNADIEDGYVFE